MKLSELKAKISNLLLLNKNILRNFEPRKDILDANIKYWIKKGDLILLKKGIYILKDKYDLKNFFPDQNFVSDFCKNYKEIMKKYLI